MTTMAATIGTGTQPRYMRADALSALRMTALGAVDLMGQTAGAVDAGISGTVGVARDTIKSGLHFAIGLVPLPQFAHSALQGTASAAVNLTAFLVEGGAKAALQMATFGAPAWSQAIRQNLAARTVLGDMGWGGCTSQEMIARAIVESDASPYMRPELRSYLALRQTLRRLEDGGSTADSDAHVSALRERITQLENSLVAHNAFANLKHALDDPKGFAHAYPDKITRLAEEAADRVLNRVQAFYTERLGVLGGTVEASRMCAPVGSPEYAQQRKELVERISGRLQNVFQNSYTEAQAAPEIRALQSEVLREFGCYRTVFKAAICSVLAVGAATGTLSQVASQAWEAARPWVSEAAHVIGEQLGTFASWVVDKVGDAVVACIEVLRDRYPALDRFLTLLESAEAGVSSVVAGAQEMVSAVVDGAQSAFDAIDPGSSGPAHFEIPRSPMITPDGVVWAESCIGVSNPYPEHLPDLAGVSGTAYTPEGIEAALSGEAPPSGEAFSQRLRDFIDAK